MKISLAIIEKIHARTQITENCWFWLGAKNSRGYGNIQIRSRPKREAAPVYRIMYEFYKGAIPEDKELDHLCRNPPCVNPMHLEPVSHKENLRRAGIIEVQQCKRGHLYNEQNSYPRLATNRQGRIYKARNCRACGRENARRYRTEKKCQSAMN